MLEDSGSSPSILPVPVHLDPPSTRGTLFSSVKGYFYQLYNANTTFREYLVSIGNKDAITENMVFDRHEAVRMIREAAKKADDSIVGSAKDGAIYKCMVRIMRKHDLGLKLRRQQYRQLTHQQ